MYGRSNFFSHHLHYNFPNSFYVYPIVGFIAEINQKILDLLIKIDNDHVVYNVYYNMQMRVFRRKSYLLSTDCLSIYSFTVVRKMNHYEENDEYER